MLGEMSKTIKDRWTEKYARTVLERAEQRKLSIAALADELGVSQQRIYWWRKRLHDGPKVRKPGFVEVRLPATPAPAPAATRAFTITTHSGRTIKVWPGFDAAELSRLIVTLEAQC